MCPWLLSLSSQQSLLCPSSHPASRSQQDVSPFCWDLSEPSCPGFLRSPGFLSPADFLHEAQRWDLRFASGFLPLLTN